MGKRLTRRRRGSSPQLDNETSSKRRFFDCPENYDPAAWAQPFHDFESAANARTYTSRLENRLRCEPTCVRTAERLHRCTRRNPCNSGACPSCKRGLRRWFILEGERTITTEWGSDPLWFVTIVGPRTRVKRGELKCFNPQTLKERSSKQMVRAGLGNCRMIGGIDWSLNGRSDAKSRWQPHLHLIVQCPAGREALRARLKKAFPPSKATRRPVQIKSVDDLRPVLGYCLKSYAERRVSYRGKNGRWQTRPLPLKPADDREMAVFQDRLPIQSALFLKNVRRRGSKLITKPKSKQVTAQDWSV